MRACVFVFVFPACLWQVIATLLVLACVCFPACRAKVMAKHFERVSVLYLFSIALACLWRSHGLFQFAVSPDGLTSQRLDSQFRDQGTGVKVEVLAAQGSEIYFRFRGLRFTACGSQFKV